MTNPNLTFSLVTPSLNQGQFIERAIESVLAQNYPRLEYIIIDGGSTDGTVAILGRYEGRLTWLSEADQGQAHAINKGFQRVAGDIVGWLNADDELTPGALAAVADFFSRCPEARLVYGEALTIDAWGRSYGRRGNVKPTNFTELAMEGDFIVQPAAFWRATLLAEVGYLDESLHYCLDYEYWLRVAQKYPLHYLPIPLARERIHAGAKSSQVNRRRLEELEQVARRYGQPTLARDFQAERTALQLGERLARIFRRRAVEETPPQPVANLLRAAPYLLARWLGPWATVYLRLYHNWWRSRFRRGKVTEGTFGSKT